MGEIRKLLDIVEPAGRGRLGHEGSEARDGRPSGDPRNFRLPDARTVGESYDEFQSDLRARSGAHGIRTLMLTGTDHGDGVSTIAARVAEAAALDASARVLLVDAHLRRPKQHLLFELGDSATLTETLLGAPSDLEPIIPSRTGSLFVLPAGGPVEDPRALFGRGRVEHLMRGLARDFDLVVIDAPPITHCIESRVLADFVDASALVLRARKTRRRAARLASQQLENSASQFIGVVINGARSHMPQWLYDRI